MKIYSTETVFEAALARLRYLFEEFPHVVVNISGGKDSTVLLQLALRIAEEKHRLPLPVLFIDQEAEWQCVIDYIRQVFADDRIQPYWLQVPLQLFNATSTTDPWLYCWEEGKAWIRDKEATSLQTNVYGTTRFAELFGAFLAYHFPQGRAINLGGMRAEESPGRRRGLTCACTYQWITWGKIRSRTRHYYDFYPLYDWSYTDIWKAIHSHGWPYCALYDWMYQYGIPTSAMRVSNVHHETAVKTLYFLQEMEPETWDALTARLSGIRTAGQLQHDFLRVPEHLPPMFANWYDYRDYLLEHLITDAQIQQKMRAQFHAVDARYTADAAADLLRMQLAMILCNDYHGTKLRTFHASHLRQLRSRQHRYVTD